MGQRFLSDDSLEINELERDRRRRAAMRTGTAQEDEEREVGQDESGLRLRNLFRRGRDLVGRLEHIALPREGT